MGVDATGTRSKSADRGDAALVEGLVPHSLPGSWRLCLDVASRVLVGATALDWSDDDSVGSGSPYVLSPNVEIRTGSVNQPSEGRPMTEDLALGAFPQALRSDVIEAITIVPMPTVRSSRKPSKDFPPSSTRTSRGRTRRFCS